MYLPILKRRMSSRSNSLRPSHLVGAHLTIKLIHMQANQALEENTVINIDNQQFSLFHGTVCLLVNTGDGILTRIPVGTLENKLTWFAETPTPSTFKQAVYLGDYKFGIRQVRTPFEELSLLPADVQSAIFNRLYSAHDRYEWEDDQQRRFDAGID